MRPRQQEVVNQVITAELEKIGVTPSAEELALHRKNYGHSGEDVFAFLDRREKWLERLREANKHTHRFNQKLFDETLAERYLASCSANSRKGLALWRRYWASDLARSINIKETYREVLKFGVKTLLRRESLRV
jgi:hypothetical protein